MFKASRLAAPALVLASTLVMACPAARMSATPVHAGGVTLNVYFHTQDGMNGVTYEKSVVSQFEAKYPSIQVNATWMADPRDTINQQLAAGGGPDILITDGTADVAKYASAGDVIPLDAYYAQYNWKPRFPTWTYPLLTYKGKIYAVPNNQQALTGIYNKTMFKKYGWKLPQTYDQLVALCKQIQAKGIIPMTLGTADIKNANEWYETVALNSTLGHDKMIQLFQGKLAWNSPLVRTAFEKLDSLYAQGFINNKQSAAVTLSQSFTEFLSGKAAIEMAGTWEVGDLSTGATRPNFDWGLFHFPSWTPGLMPTLPVGVGQTFLINAHSAHKAAAAQFLDFAETPSVLTKGAVFWGLPGLANLNLQTLGVMGPHFLEAASVVQGAIKSGNNGFVSWCFWPPSTRVYALNNIEAVWFGQLSLTDFLNQLEKTYQQDKASGQYVLF